MYVFFLMWSQLTKALMDEQFPKNTFFFAVKVELYTRHYLDPHPWMFPKGVCHATLNPDATCAKWTHAYFISIRSSLASVRFRARCAKSVSVANLSQGWFHARRHELKSIRTMKLQQNTCITLLKTIAWIFSLKRSPESGLLFAKRRTETVWKLRRHVSPSFGLSISIKANSVSYQLFNSLHHMVSLNPICSH